MGIIRKIMKNVLPYYFVRKYQESKNTQGYKYVSCRILTDILEKERQEFALKHWDYIRASSLEYISNEIYDKNISGNIAELGVYQGKFASLINKAFPDRKLYLFDTFEGFDERDYSAEEENNYSTKEKRFKAKNIHLKTSVELVMERITHKQNCIIKQGYFPETAFGINDIFSFVSIDVNLYDPTYKGLNYFYEMLNKGGYIMVHDYNNKNYKGVKAALRKFSEEKNVSYFPLCDFGGSAVIMKY
jgi:O-methyltransferase